MLEGLVNQDKLSAAVHLLEAVAGGIARPYEAARAQSGGKATPI
ncbi:MAG: hypothetical protein R3D26_18140 [Cyanobacteriota/Melainabacteria group bacterium]